MSAALKQRVAPLPPGPPPKAAKDKRQMIMLTPIYVLRVAPILFAMSAV
jgi:hypothetical protein